VSGKVLIPVALVAAIGFGAGGYALGHSNASTDENAAKEQADSQADAYNEAFASAQDEARARGLRAGQIIGGRAGNLAGSDAGESDGSTGVDEQVAASTPSPPLVQLPNGEPGYSLPEDQRTLGCIGVEAATGQCVGD
jgi:hypothetical protein